MDVVAFLPYAFMCYLSPLVTMAIGFLRFRKDTFPEGEDARAVYGTERSELPESRLSA